MFPLKDNIPSSRFPVITVALIALNLQFLPAVGQLATPDVAGQGGIAYLAHVGGFVFGLVAIKPFANRAQEVEPEARYPVY